MPDDDEFEPEEIADRLIHRLTARDVRLMLSFTEARIPEYVEDDSDLLLNDDA